MRRITALTGNYAYTGSSSKRLRWVVDHQLEGYSVDDLYMDYINRMARLALAETYGSQLAYAQPSAKYRKSDAGAVPEPFPGYSVITPPGPEDPHNESVYSELAALQGQLNRQLPGLLGLLPAHSFHLTLADLIWDDAYRAAAELPDFHSKLQQAIAYSLQDYNHRYARPNEPCLWQILGLVAMPRAIGVGLAPKTEAAYRQVLDLRRAIYQNRNLMALGIEQQYHLTAHITLGYFTEQVTATDPGQIQGVITALNDSWQAQSAQMFCVGAVELRQFEDMTAFRREADWPRLSLVKG